MGTIFELLQKPFVQLLLAMLLTILFISILGPKNTDHTWNIAGLVYIGFMIINSILICTVSNSWRYLIYSLGFSIVYLVCISMIVPAITKFLKIEGSAESAMIFISFIYHPVLLLAMIFLKWAYLKFF